MIKNIAIGSKIPDKRMTVHNGEVVEIKKSYKIVNGQPVVIWDISDENILLLKFNVTNYQLTLPSFSKISTGYLIDWGDGTSENAAVPTAIVHTYEENKIYTVTLKYQLETSVSIATAFKNNSELIYADMSKSKLKLATNSFYNCTALQNIVITDDIASIPASCFANCSNLEKISNIESIITINTSSFDDCSNLKQFYSPVLQTIGERAFALCKTIEKFELPDSIKSLGSSAFYSSGLSGTFVIPEQITSISSTFQKCENLTEIYGLGLSYIGVFSFKNCDNLKIFHFSNKLASIGNEAFKLPSDNIIYFSGTQAEWEAVTKTSRWNVNGANPNVIYI